MSTFLGFNNEVKAFWVDLSNNGSTDMTTCCDSWNYLPEDASEPNTTLPVAEPWPLRKRRVLCSQPIQILTWGFPTFQATQHFHVLMDQWWWREGKQRVRFEGAFSERVNMHMHKMYFTNVVRSVSQSCHVVCCWQTKLCLHLGLSLI